MLEWEVTVEDVYSELGRPPKSPIDVKGESVVEGSVLSDKIVKKTRLNKEDIDKIKTQIKNSK